MPSQFQRDKLLIIVALANIYIQHRCYVRIPKMRAIPQLVSALLNLSNEENIKFKATCRLWLGARQCYYTVLFPKTCLHLVGDSVEISTPFINELEYSFKI